MFLSDEVVKTGIHLDSSLALVSQKDYFALQPASKAKKNLIFFRTATLLKYTTVPEIDVVWSRQQVTPRRIRFQTGKSALQSPPLHCSKTDPARSRFQWAGTTVAKQIRPVSVETSARIFFWSLEVEAATVGARYPTSKTSPKSGSQFKQERDGSGSQFTRSGMGWDYFLNFGLGVGRDKISFYGSGTGQE
ncbi:hypothetical protein DPX16_23581 [Anabarilius grahami]|uniref:Uncharacterized protein n=1 Tax=Anabarilius grahami TaxID=495550 RepID=A0A3N0XSD2_ANAGA|nr:hypothetical protein DPX16_23581 [Anabarilius grahami]